MKASFLLALLFATAVAGTVAVPSFAQQLTAPEVASQNSVAAIVNGKVITRNEVEMAAKYQLMMSRE